MWWNATSSACAKPRGTSRTISRRVTPGFAGVWSRTSANVLRHAYDQVLDEHIWDIVTDDLPPLKAAVEAMLREAEKSGLDRA
jgi:Protein of unknown function DUF86